MQCYNNTIIIKLFDLVCPTEVEYSIPRTIYDFLNFSENILILIEMLVFLF